MTSGRPAGSFATTLVGSNVKVSPIKFFSDTSFFFVYGHAAKVQVQSFNVKASRLKLVFIRLNVKVSLLKVQSVKMSRSVTLSSMLFGKNVKARG